MHNYKNDVMCKFVSNDYNNPEAVENVIKYAARKEKSCALYMNKCPQKIRACVQSFYDLQQAYGFPNSFQNRIIHFIVSPSNIHLGIDTLNAIISALQTAWKPLQFICSIHNDTTHPHIHIVINSLIPDTGDQIDAHALYSNLGYIIKQLGYTTHLE